MSTIEAYNGRRPYYLALDPLLPWARVERPVDWTRRLGRTAPLEVEIGFGNGEALARKAQANPDWDFVGLELSWASVKRALRRLAKAGVTNTRLLELDAETTFRRFFSQRSITRVQALFPVPWPKDRHESRRLFAHDFLHLVNSRLVDGGSIQIVTDFEPYRDWVLGQVPETGFTVNLEPIQARFDTKYERKWQDNGQDTFHEIILAKEHHIDVPVVEDLPVLSYRIKDFDHSRFAPQSQAGPVTVQFRESLYDPIQRKAMLRAFVAEGRFTQEVWLIIVDEGEYWHLGLAAGNAVVPTEGVKRALELARQALD
jgi:tRNA (guanine-N7-)-methyltransferase